MSFTMLQNRFNRPIYRAFGYSIGFSEYLETLARKEILHVLRTRKSRWAIPYDLWIELPVDEQARLSAFIESSDAYGTPKQKSHVHLAPGITPKRPNKK